MLKRELRPRKAFTPRAERPRASGADVPYAEHGEDRSRMRKRRAFWASSLMTALVLRAW